MLDRTKQDLGSRIKNLESSVRDAVENMSAPQITALIEFAERTRQHKLENARDELLAEFRKRALDLGLPLESLMTQRSEVRSRKPAGSGNKLPVKYRGPNREEWTGRGRLPGWLAALEAEGHKREEYAV